MPSRVAVLLAAYNGVKYLPQQLESILSQVGVFVDVYISVDDSTDGTEQYILKESEKFNNIHPLPFGMKFGGAAKNFYHLLMNVDISKYDYISLSDQDDIWESNKLIRGIEKLIENRVNGYSSNVMAFWESGRNILIDKSQPQVKYDYLFEAAGPGCTYILDVKLANDIGAFINNNYKALSGIDLHDWFIYAYARSNNYSWYIDSYPGMKYRQHASNQVGANESLSGALKRLYLIRRKWYRNQIINIATILQLNNNPFVQRTLYNGYMGNIYMAFKIHQTRRRLRDRALLSLALFLNFF
ncbi:glycosyltransferase [Aeromonas veronii]|uniref:glycosyltransferase n=1 Tax=Aeromonas veronii TaxID=654 RepID=UPI00211D3FE6|nr:glycosyltransferase [Aeromonas veronii]UUM70163.1 glycosyltransferase [Aeromonas veronii]